MKETKRNLKNAGIVVATGIMRIIITEIMIDVMYVMVPENFL